MCQYDITMYPFCGQGKEITCSLAATCKPLMIFSSYPSFPVLTYHSR